VSIGNNLKERIEARRQQKVWQFQELTEHNSLRQQPTETQAAKPNTAFKKLIRKLSKKIKPTNFASSIPFGTPKRTSKAGWRL
jgi:hypothetical protein